MPNVKELAEDFLSQKRIAVAGVSRSDRNAPANAIYRKLRELGYEVFALNPNAESVENDRCYPNLQAIGEKVDAMVIAAPPQAAIGLVRDCAQAGVARVWLHRSFGAGSVSQDAVKFCREHGMTVIAGACPMMYCRQADLGHRCMRWLLAMSGGMPA